MEDGASAVAPAREEEVRHILVDEEMYWKLFNKRFPLVVYRVGINKEPIEEWLEKYKPSTVSK